MEKKMVGNQWEWPHPEVKMTRGKLSCWHMSQLRGLDLCWYEAWCIGMRRDGVCCAVLARGKFPYSSFKLSNANHIHQKLENITFASLDNKIVVRWRRIINLYIPSSWNCFVSCVCVCDISEAASGADVRLFSMESPEKNQYPSFYTISKLIYSVGPFNVEANL